MSDYTYITKECPFCNNEMYREYSESDSTTYTCYSCGFQANFDNDRIPEEVQIGYTKY